MLISSAESDFGELLLNSKATKLEETIDRMKSKEKEYEWKISEERKWVKDNQETMKKVN